MGLWARTMVPAPWLRCEGQWCHLLVANQTNYQEPLSRKVGWKQGKAVSDGGKFKHPRDRPLQKQQKTQHPKQKPCFLTKKLKTKPKRAKSIKGVQFTETPSLEFCD